MSLDTLSHFLQNFPAEIVLIAEYFICCLTLLVMLWAFRLNGLFVYMALAVVIANIQVLKAVNVSFLNYPVALGTTIFSSIFLATEIITEFYGARLARKAVWSGFAASIMILIFMTLTLGIKPAVDPQGAFNTVHTAVNVIFSPAPALIAASLISFLISQHTDIWIFKTIRALTGQKKLWLRTLCAALLSAFVDNVLFSIMAWKIFTKNPVTSEQLIFTYILGTYILRVIIIVLQVPLMYGVRTFMKRESYADL